MNRHIGPHVPCILRTFFVLSLVAIPIGIGMIAGGVLIIVSIGGQTAAACGAVVIFVGLCVTTIPPIMSFKVFGLRIKMFEGRPRIAKSYGDFPDNLTRRGMGPKSSFYDISDPIHPTTGGYGPSIPVRAQYMPEQKVAEGQTGMEEASTSFARNRDYRSGATAGERNPYDVSSETGETSRQQIPASLVKDTVHKFPRAKAAAPKPPRQKRDDAVREPVGIYNISAVASNSASGGVTTGSPRRNVSSLYPTVNA